MRMRDALKAELEEAAEANQRSLSEEIEHQLEEQRLYRPMLAHLGRTGVEAMFEFSAAIAVIEETIGKRWDHNEETIEAVMQRAVEGVLRLKRSSSPISKAAEATEPDSNSITAPLGTGVGPAAAPAVALYIDRQQLSRDLVGEQLAGHLADWTVRSVMSIRDVTSLADLSKVSVIVFNSHHGSLGSGEVRDELMAIRVAAPGAPLIVMSDLEDGAEVRRAIYHDARGYLPASLPLTEAMAAIRFVKDGGMYIPRGLLTRDEPAAPPPVEALPTNP
jgi:hypothetical protein